MQLENIRLFGDRVVVRLDTVSDFTAPSGFLTPKFENTTTAGGLPAVKRSSDNFTSTGTIIYLSPQANKNLSQELDPSSLLSQKVLLSPQALSHQFAFYPQRNYTTLPPTDLVCIPSALIEGYYERITTNTDSQEQAA
jgi:hypothetical protein